MSFSASKTLHCCRWEREYVILKKRNDSIWINQLFIFRTSVTPNRLTGPLFVYLLFAHICVVFRRLARRLEWSIPFSEQWYDYRMSQLIIFRFLTVNQVLMLTSVCFSCIVWQRPISVVGRFVIEPDTRRQYVYRICVHFFSFLFYKKLYGTIQYAVEYVGCGQCDWNVSWMLNNKKWRMQCSFER